MNKTKILSLTCFLASATMLSAQFNPLPPNPYTLVTSGSQVTEYQNLVSSQGWNVPIDTSTWGAPPVNLDPPPGFMFGANASMNVFFIGETANWVNDFGIHLGSVNEQYSNSMSTFGQNQSIFNQINMPSPDIGHYVNIPLAGVTNFDFWLSGKDNDPNKLRGGIWSMFFPEYNNPDNAYSQGRGTVEVVNGKTYYLFAFEDWDATRGSDRDHDDLVFAVEIFGGIQVIPEPSTYATFGVLALLGIMSLRTFRGKRRS